MLKSSYSIQDFNETIEGGVSGKPKDVVYLIMFADWIKRSYWQIKKCLRADIMRDSGSLIPRGPSFTGLPWGYSLFRGSIRVIKDLGRPATSTTVYHSLRCETLSSIQFFVIPLFTPVKSVATGTCIPLSRANRNSLTDLLLRVRTAIRNLSERLAELAKN